MADEQKQFDTRFNYQKVALAGTLTQSVDVSSGGPPVPATLVAVPHNLGRITSFRAWYDPGLGVRIPVSGKLTTPIINNNINMDAYLTANDLVFSIFNFGASAVDIVFYYRVYYDAN